MGAMSVVEAWDRSLRAGDWETAQSLLADDATYQGSKDLDANFNCTNGDQIVDLMRSWKGSSPMSRWSSGRPSVTRSWQGCVSPSGAKTPTGIRCCQSRTT